MKWTEALVLDVLRETFLVRDPQTQMDEWAMLSHVPLRCLTEEGRQARAAGKQLTSAHVNERIIDALLVRCWGGGKGHERIAFEVKVSRPDYKNETPEKRAPAEASAHLCAYVVPAGLITPGELPEGWGLVEVYEDRADRKHALGWRATWTVKPRRRTPRIDLDYLVSAGFRRASRAEEKIRTGVVPAAEYARMQEKVTSLEGIADRALASARRETTRAKAARSELLAAAGPLDCADCHQAVTWKRGGPVDASWAHTNKAHDATCTKIRQEIDRKQREADTGAEYMWGLAGPIEPVQIRQQRLAEEQENQAQEAAS